MSSVWLPFSNADIGLLWLLSDFYEGYKPNQTVQDFLPFTYVTTLLKDTEQISVPFWLTELNVEQKENQLFAPRKIKPMQSGFTVNYKSSYDVIKKTRKHLYH